MKLVPEFKEKWLAALRSGEYEQATGSLKFADGYCCLGVAAHIVATELPHLIPSGCEIREGEFAMKITEDDDNELSTSCLTVGLCGALGLTGDECDILIRMNDGHHPFRDIADQIEVLDSGPKQAA